MQAESVPMEVIRALVGHAKTNMTEHYLHIVETVKIEAVNKLNAYCE
jgi:hypothetical protein